MRRASFALAAIGLLFTGGFAHAQTYDPSYPVCMQIYGPVGYFDCGYASLAQCRFLAVGRSASCVVNPYYEQTRPAAGRRVKRGR